MQIPRCLYLVIATLPLVWTQYNISRGSNFDTFSFQSCTNCGPYSSFCTTSSGCCKDCRCNYGKTLFINKEEKLQCLASPGHEFGCKYHFLGYEQRGMALLPFKLNPGAAISQIGVMIVPGKDPEKCQFISNECKYWDRTKWNALFTDGREGKDFFIEDEAKKTSKLIKFNLHNKDESLYKGLLVKMQVSCEEQVLSCLMFKFEGVHIYETIVKPTGQTVSSPAWKTMSTAAPSKSSDNTNVAAIVSVAVLLVLIAVVIVAVLLWRKRRRKGKSKSSGSNFTRSKNQHSQKFLLKKDDSNKEDVVYQSPENIFTDNNFEDANFDNPGYLIPVDSKQKKKPGEVVYLDPDAVLIKKKDPNYDYPDLEKTKLKGQKENSSASHVYARVSVEDGVKEPVSTGEYTDLSVNSANTSVGYETLNRDSQIKPVTPPVTPKYFELDQENKSGRNEAGKDAIGQVTLTDPGETDI